MKRKACAARRESLALYAARYRPALRPWMAQFVALIVTAILSALLSACGTSSAVAPLGRAATRAPSVAIAATRAPRPTTRTPPPASGAASSQDQHSVVDGESLYSIAWRYGLDYRQLSRWNAIAEPYTIYPSQVLRLTRPRVLPPMPTTSSPAVQALSSPPRRSKTAPARVASSAKTKPTSKTVVALPKATGLPKSAKPKSAKPKVVATPQSDNAVRSWRWPIRGKIIGAFGKDGGKGIDIAGRRGSAIKAAAAGRVVYSGSGLRGYGKLVIVKHNKRYLSAYAHNDRLHVEEGDTVKRGQRIAQMGDSGSKSVRLHFEIRRDGRPVDPTKFLPR